MLDKKLWKQLSPLLRRQLRPIPSFHHGPDFEIQSFSSFIVSLVHSHFEEFRVSGAPPPPHFFLEDSRVRGMRFCSRSCEDGAGSRCWNCDSVLLSSKLSLVCESCRSVQPVDHSIDYFRIFGLEKKFDIEQDGLEGKYKGWQKKLHPDLVHSKSERERRYAAEQSARVIDAYRTLSDPLSRAIYLMKLEGIHVDEEQTVSDPKLLVEIMEIREAVEEASDPRGLKDIQSQVQEKLKHWSESFLRAFQCQSTDDAVNSIRRMTYYKRIDEEIVKRL
ncbi:hypothetical protein Dimus_037127 [Dionaea muscipula]